MFQNGTIRTAFATGISLLAGTWACKMDLPNGWLTFVDWAGFYIPLSIVSAGAAVDWEREPYF